MLYASVFSPLLMDRSASIRVAPEPWRSGDIEIPRVGAGEQWRLGATLAVGDDAFKLQPTAQPAAGGGRRRARVRRFRGRSTDGILKVYLRVRVTLRQSTRGAPPRRSPLPARVLPGAAPPLPGPRSAPPGPATRQSP